MSPFLAAILQKKGNFLSKFDFDILKQSRNIGPSLTNLLQFEFVAVTDVKFGVTKAVDAIKKAICPICALEHNVTRTFEAFEQPCHVIYGDDRKCSSWLIDNIFPLLVRLQQQINAL